MTTKLKIRIKTLDNFGDLQLPSYETSGSAGVDLRCTSDFNLDPQTWSAVSTGISLAIPEGYEAQIRPRSGLSFKKGLTVLNSPGTIDSDYRGEIKVILYNASNDTFLGNRGDRIAQMVIAPVVQAEFIAVETLDDTSRGDLGFGSTGVK